MSQTERWHKSEGFPNATFWQRWNAKEDHVTSDTGNVHAVFSISIAGSNTSLNLVISAGHENQCATYLNTRTGDEILLFSSMKKIPHLGYDSNYCEFKILKRFGTTGNVVDLSQIAESIHPFALKTADASFHNLSGSSEQKTICMNRLEQLIGHCVENGDLD